MLTGRPLTVAKAVPFTRLLMNGAAGFLKIGWGEVWLAGCVQLWFSRAITKTFLILPPSSAAAAVTAKAAVKQPKSIEYFICHSPVVIRNGKNVLAPRPSHPPRTHLRQGHDRMAL